MSNLVASILSADLTCLGEEVNTVLSAGADGIHIDVMDHHYVPNLTFGPIVCQALYQMNPSIFLDVHLMVQPVDPLMIEAFSKAGARSISFHPEASFHIDRHLTLIREQGCQAGLAINPATSLEVLRHVWDKLDFILIMSVNPGFGGQVFIREALNKIKEARQVIHQKQYNCKIAVDGGINSDNIGEIAASGADTFIVGSTIFQAKDYRAVIRKLRSALQNPI